MPDPTPKTTSNDDGLLKIEHVRKIAGIGRTAIYKLELAGKFPQLYNSSVYASREK